MIAHHNTEQTGNRWKNISFFVKPLSRCCLNKTFPQKPIKKNGGTREPSSRKNSRQLEPKSSTLAPRRVPYEDFAWFRSLAVYLCLLQVVLPFVRELVHNGPTNDVLQGFLRGGLVVIPRIFPKVPQSFLGILRVPQLPPPLEHHPLEQPYERWRKKKMFTNDISEANHYKWMHTKTHPKKMFVWLVGWSVRSGKNVILNEMFLLMYFSMRWIVSSFRYTLKVQRPIWKNRSSPKTVFWVGSLSIQNWRHIFQ